jgi:hypothetical protein
MKNYEFKKIVIAENHGGGGGGDPIPLGGAPRWQVVRGPPNPDYGPVYAHCANWTQFASLDSSFPGTSFIFCRTFVAGFSNMVEKNPPKTKVFEKPVFFHFYWLKFTSIDRADISLPFPAIFNILYLRS